MFELSSVSELNLLLPVLLIGVGWILSRVLSIPWWIFNIVGALPLVAIWAEFPFSRFLADYEPLALVGIVWTALIAVACGLSVGGAAVRMSRVGVGVLLQLLTIGSWLSAIIVGLLYFKPDSLDFFVPGWKSSFGLVLCILAMLGVCFSIFKFVRATSVLAFWLFICLSMGTEVFLDRLPAEVLVDELQGRGALSLDRVGASLFDRLPAFDSERVDSSEKARRIVVIGGDSGRSDPLAQQASYIDKLKIRIAKAYPDQAYQVIDASSKNLGVTQISKKFDEIVSKLKPDLLVMSGWFADSQLGTNFYGFKGLDDSEADSKAKWIARLDSVPLLNSIVNSKLFKSAALLLSSEKSSAEESKPRTSPSRYREILSSLLKSAKESKVSTIVFHEPIDPVSSSELEAQYYNDLVSVARENGAIFANVDQAFKDKKEELLFLKDNILSKFGHQLVADELFKSVSSWHSDRVRQAGLLEQAAWKQRDNLKLALSKKQLLPELSFNIKVPKASNRYFKAILSANGEHVASKRLTGSDFQKVSFALGEKFRRYPAANIELITLPAPGSNSDLIGSSKIYTPLTLKVFSDAQSQQRKLFVQAGHNELAFDKEGFAFVALDYRNGNVLDEGFFAPLVSEESFVRKLKKLTWGSIVAISAVLPETWELNSELRSALGHLGASTFPKPGMAYSLIGTVATGEGKAVVKLGSEAQKIEIGSERLRDLSRFVVAEVEAGGERVYG